jgi:hypothetical protein
LFESLLYHTSKMLIDLIVYNICLIEIQLSMQFLTEVFLIPTQISIALTVPTISRALGLL